MPVGAEVLDVPCGAGRLSLALARSCYSMTAVDWSAEFLTLVANAYDHRTTRLDIEYTFVVNGRVEVRRGSHQVYSYRALVPLIEAAGFGVEPDQPWTRERRNLSFIATRR